MDNEAVTKPILSHIAVLHRTSRIVSSGLTLDEMLKELIALTVEVTECDACLVYLPDKESGEIVLRASQLPHDVEIGRLRLRMGEGITGWVAQNKTVVALSSNAFKDERFSRVPTFVEDTYEAFLSVPLVSGGEVIGVLNVHHKDPHTHTPAEISLLSFIGEQMGGAITLSQLTNENARLEKEAIEARQELESRKFVERAKGILQMRFGLNEQEAYQRLRNESRRLRRPIRELAEAILMVEDLGQSREAESDHAPDDSIRVVYPVEALPEKR
jgi:uroporphyrinogen-III synthase